MDHELRQAALGVLMHDAMADSQARTLAAISILRETSEDSAVVTELQALRGLIEHWMTQRMGPPSS
jgi:hypothetical protein